jgi:hypothetical protein
MKKFLLKFSDSLLSKEEIRSVKGGYDGGGGGGGGGGPYNPTYTLWCYRNNQSLGPITGSGCPSFNQANSICGWVYPGSIESNLYC